MLKGCGLRGRGGKGLMIKGVSIKGENLETWRGERVTLSTETGDNGWIETIHHK